MIKSDNIVKTCTRFKLRKQQSTYRESHDDDGGDWNGAGTASRIHSGIEGLELTSLSLRKHEHFSLILRELKHFYGKMGRCNDCFNTYTSL